VRTPEPVDGVPELPGALTGVTVILPVINETTALTTTIDTILADCDRMIDQFLIVTSDRTTRESLETAADLHRRHEGRLAIERQRRPFLGGALRDALDKVATSHVIVMSSDLETDPGAVRAMIAVARAHPAKIVAASRWRGGAGAPPGYGRLKAVCNRVFQMLFSSLYRARLTDLSHGFRIYPTAVMRAVVWEELRHPFLFETLVKPLRLGVPVVEVPAAWHGRVGGTSQNRLLNYLAYFRVGIAVRFRDRSTFLLPMPPKSPEQNELI
jgi:glycosyltransferase involved in cell wall biosynthesis